MAGGKTCLLAALCSLVILAAFVDDTHSASCCLSYSGREVPCRRSIGYTIQSINTTCDIPAVIFHLRGRFVCADPLQEWTQRTMRCVDERQRRTKQILHDRTSGHAK